MERRGSLRELLSLVGLVLVCIPMVIFGLLKMPFDRSPPFRHGPYNGHEYPEDI